MPETEFCMLYIAGSIASISIADVGGGLHHASLFKLKAQCGMSRQIRENNEVESLRIHVLCRILQRILYL